MARQFQEVKADFVRVGDPKESTPEKPKVESVEGILVMKDSMTLSNGVVGKYTIQPEDEDGNPGDEVTFLGGADVDSKMARVEQGAYVRVSWQGKQKTGNNRDMNVFAVEVAEA